MTTNFDLDTTKTDKQIIKVIGVGGAGSNAVNYMYELGIKDVEFLVCNTDLQHLRKSPVPNKLQLGRDLTNGLGAGNKPEVGREAAIESKEDIVNVLKDGTEMVFITAGMGGGTGTGAAPIIASIARELDILTVGIVTLPLRNEGPKRRDHAAEGIKLLKKDCDSVITILNDKIIEQYGDMPMRKAFAKANSVLATAARSIAEIITVESEINVDFKDVKTVMTSSKTAVMGSAIVVGENRARTAAEEALKSPLLDSADISGASHVLISFMQGTETDILTSEMDEMLEYVRACSGEQANVIWGHGTDENLTEEISVTIIATGFPDDDQYQPEPEASADDEAAIKKVVYKAETNQPIPQPQAPQPQQPQPQYVQPGEVTVRNEHLAPQPQPVAKPLSRVDILKRKADERRIKANTQLNRVFTQQELQELNEEAFRRKRVKMTPNPASDDESVNRFTVNGKEIIGGNRYLHQQAD